MMHLSVGAFALTLLMLAFGHPASASSGYTTDFATALLSVPSSVNFEPINANTPDSTVQVDGNAASARFMNPTDVSVTPDGLFAFISEYWGRAVRRMSLVTGSVQTVAGPGHTTGYLSGVDASGSDNQVYFTGGECSGFTKQFNRNLDSVSGFSNFGGIDVTRCTQDNGQDLVIALSWSCGDKSIKAFTASDGNLQWELTGQGNAEDIHDDRVTHIEELRPSVSSVSARPDCSELAVSQEGKVRVIDLNSKSITDTYVVGSSSRMSWGGPDHGLLIVTDSSNSDSWKDEPHVKIIDHSFTKQIFKTPQIRPTFPDGVWSSFSLAAVGTGPDLVLTYNHGVSVARLAQLKGCRLADLNLDQFAHIDRSNLTSGVAVGGQEMVLDQCDHEAGYIGLGNVSITCSLGSWQMQNNNFACEKLCSCPNGSPSIGDDCASPGAQSCESCDEGHRAEAGQCVANQCTCNNGSVASGKDCPLDGAESCAFCDAGFWFQPGQDGLVRCEPRMCTVDFDSSLLNSPTVDFGTEGYDPAVDGNVTTSRYGLLYDLSITQDKAEVFITSKSNRSVRVMSTIDGSSRTVITQEELHSEPLRVDASGPGMVYVTTESHKVFGYDRVTEKTIQIPLQGGGTSGITRCTQPDGTDLVMLARSIYVRASSVSGSSATFLWQLGTSNWKPRQVRPELGQTGKYIEFPKIHDIAVSKDCSQLALSVGPTANSSAGAHVLVVDTASRTLTDIYDVPGSGSGGVTWAGSNDEFIVSASIKKGLAVIDHAGTKTVDQSTNFRPWFTFQYWDELVGVDAFGGASDAVAVVRKNGVSIVTLPELGDCEITCACAQGQAVTGSACPFNAAHLCASCDQGFHVENDRCVQNECECDFGWGTSKFECSNHGGKNCSRCQQPVFDARRLLEWSQGYYLKKSSDNNIFECIVEPVVCSAVDHGNCTACSGPTATECTALQCDPCWANTNANMVDGCEAEAIDVPCTAAPDVEDTNRKSGRDRRAKFRATIQLPGQADNQTKIGRRIARDLQTELRKLFPKLLVRFVDWTFIGFTQQRRLLNSGQWDAQLEFSSTSTDASDTTAADAAGHFVKSLASTDDAQTLSDMMAASVSAVDSTAGNSMKVDTQKASVEEVGGNKNSGNSGNSSKSDSAGVSGALIGGIAGGVVAVAALIGLFVYLRNKGKTVRNNKKHSPAIAGHEQTSAPSRSASQSIEIVTEINKS